MSTTTLADILFSTSGIMLIATSLAASFHYKKNSSLSVGLASVCLAAWMIGSVVSDQADSWTAKLWALRIASSIGIWFIYFFWLFCRQKFSLKRSSHSEWALAGIFLAMSVLVSTNHGLATITVTNDSSQPDQINSAYHLTVALLIYCFVTSAITLVRANRSAKSSLSTKLATKKILLSLVIIFVGNFTSNYLLIGLGNINAWSDIISGLSLTVFCLILWSTIIENELLEFRSYLIEIISIGLLVLGTTLITKLLLEPVDSGHLVSYLAPVISVLLFITAQTPLRNTLRNFIDSGHYDDAQELNKLIKKLVTAESHDYVTKSCLKTLSSSLKTNIAVDGRNFQALPRLNGRNFSNRDREFIRSVTRLHKEALEVQDKNAEIKNFNIKLRHDIKQATKKLRSANDKLKVNDKQKDDFISMASHQLKPQISAASGFFEISKGDPEVVNLGIETMRRIARLTDDFLNLTKIEAGRLVPKVTEFDIGDLIKSLLNKHKFSSDRKQINLEYLELNINLKSDPILVAEIIDNLIENAINYSPRGASVTVSVLEASDVVKVTVVDNGIGVPQNEINLLFTKFGRLSNARDHQSKGSGIGLYVAKKIAKELGGNISYAKNTPIGSVFMLQFPLTN